MGHRISLSDCEDVDILTDDALVYTFSYLAIDEKLKVSRVCRRWRSVVADGRLWKRIDLLKRPTQKKRSSPLTPRESSKTKMWWSQDRLLTTEESALIFLQRYAGPSLKAIYLRIISEDIFIHLRQKCRNLKTISFLPKQHFSECALDPIRFSQNVSKNFAELIFIPDRIERLQLTLKGMHLKSADKISLSDKLMSCLSGCNDLSRLHLDDFCLTQTGLTSLTKRLNLTKLWLTDIREDPRILDVILSSAVDDLTGLVSFSLSTNNSYIGNISVFIRLCASKWRQLQHLGLKGGILCPNDVFEDLTSTLTHLKSLELEGSIITNSIISIIATNLKTLANLELTNGYYTAQGIKHLSSHQCLKTLGLYQKQLTPSPLWLHAVYDVIATLPNIMNVKLIGNRLVELYEGEFYVLKVVNSDVKILIQDSVLAIKLQRRSSVPHTVRVRHSRHSVQMLPLDVN